MDVSELSSKNINNISSQQPNSDQVKESNKASQEKVETNREVVEKRNEKKAEELEEGKLDEATEKLNETVQTFHEDLQFEVHEKSERMFAKLVDLEKHETIKEFPPEEMLDMLGRIKEAVGLIIDKKI